MQKEVKIDGILGNYKILGPDKLTLLFNRARYLAQSPKKEKQRVDFGWLIWSLPPDPFTRGDFDNLIKKLKIKKLDANLMDEIVKAFTNSAGLIKTVEMKEKYLSLYPDSKPPPVKEKKKRKEKKRKGE